ncbi:Pancreatic progenitor cell differentiation and proliferation factor-like, partial [Calypte anna]
MASVPSAGCLLARKQYYRNQDKAYLGIVPFFQTVFYFSMLVNQCLMMWASSPLAGLPESIDKCWWVKGFFHSGSSPPAVSRKTLSAS